MTQFTTKYGYSDLGQKTISEEGHYYYSYPKGGGFPGGSSWTTSKTFPYGWGYRSPKVNGPVISPNGNLWRQPTSYKRSGVVVDITPGIAEVHQKATYRGQAEVDGREVFIPDRFIWSWDFTPPIVDPSVPGVVPSAELMAKSIDKALNRFYDGTAGWGENIAEASKTYEQVARQGKLLLSAALAARRGNIRRVWELMGGNSAVRTSAGVYLQWKFGWLPLCVDIHDTVKNFRSLSSKIQNLRGVGSASDSAMATKTSPNVSSGKAKRSVRTVLHARIADPHMRLWGQMGISNPLELAWDLIPYSFVVDWFSPVGNILRDLQAPLGMTFLGGSSTWWAEGSLEREYNQAPPGDASYRWTTKAKAKWTFGMLDRVAYYDWPKPPSLYAKSPFSNSHAATSLALLMQRLT